MTDIPRIEGTMVKSRFLVTSVGCSSVDDLMGGGIPVSGIYLIDECCSRVYASVLERYFIAEGVLSKHDILLASPQERSAELLAKLPSKTIDDLESTKDEHLRQSTMGGNEMKIAWRYSSMPKFGSNEKARGKPQLDLSKAMDSSLLEQYEVTVFPQAGGDAGTVSNEPSCSYEGLWSNIRQKICLPKYAASSSGPRNVLRIVIEDLCSPLWEDSGKVLRFLACLRATVSESLAVVMLTIDSTGVDNDLRDKIYAYCDAAFCLEALDKDSASGGVEECFDGYFRIIKLPSLTSIATFCPESTDLIFELHRKYFDVRILHLPPALGDAKSNTKLACATVLDQF